MESNEDSCRVDGLDCKREAKNLVRIGMNLPAKFRIPLKLRVDEREKEIRVAVLRYRNENLVRWHPLVIAAGEISRSIHATQLLPHALFFALDNSRVLILSR